MPTELGTIAGLWRYPVKSMQGEPLRSAQITARGIPGDRAYALVETASGKVASAKNPRKWGALLQWRATFLEEPRDGATAPAVKITFPSGRAVSSRDRDADAVLSAEIGCAVTLRTSAGAAPVIEESALEDPIDGRGGKDKDEPIALGAPPGTFFDFAPIHIVTNDTLERLSAAQRASRFDVSRFRPNVLLTRSNAGNARAETEWIGTSVTAPGGLRLNVVMPTPRCVMTTLPHADVPHDPAILRTAAEHSRAMITPLRKEMPSVGVYALVERPGMLRVGDTLSSAPTTVTRKAAFWWTLVSNLARRGLPRAAKRA